jgi:hypothetical protein
MALIANCRLCRESHCAECRHADLSYAMDKLKLSGQNLDRVFNIRHGRVSNTCTSFITEKLPNLKRKTQSAPLTFANSAYVNCRCAVAVAI